MTLQRCCASCGRWTSSAAWETKPGTWQFTQICPACSAENNAGDVRKRLSEPEPQPAPAEPPASA